jgi:hypothetical protein
MASNPLDLEADEFYDEMKAIMDDADAAISSCDPQSEEYKNAKEIRWYIADMCHSITKGQFHVALRRALVIGMNFERASEFRYVYPLAFHAQKSRKALPQARAAKEQKTQAEYLEIASDVSAIMRANRRNSLTYAREQVAAARVIALGKVKTATMGMKGQPKIPKK